MEQNNEIWYDIDGFDGVYQISNQLRFRSKDRPKGVHNKSRVQKGKILTVQFKTRKYPSISLIKKGDKKNKPFLVHRLVANQFIPNPENKSQLNHINGNKHDYSISNIEWCTASENALHAYRTGLMKGIVGVDNKTFSGKNGCAKLVLDTEMGIFYDCARDVARCFGWNKYKVYSMLHAKKHRRFIYA